MRHDGNGGRKSASDFSRFPVSASVSYTYLHEPDEAKRPDETRPYRYGTCLELAEGDSFPIFPEKWFAFSLVLDITFETTTP